MCHKSEDPIFVTKNGYGDMVIMSIEVYEKMSYINDIYKKIKQGGWYAPQKLDTFGGAYFYGKERAKI